MVAPKPITSARAAAAMEVSVVIFDSGLRSWGEQFRTQI
jgi:hypothetical protein